MTKKITPSFKSISTKSLRLAIACTALFFGAAASAQTTRFVKPSATGTGDGTTWDNAASDLQLMINTSVKGDAIWVAGGTYKPIRKANDLAAIALNNRDNAFVLKDSVQIYGGFAGTELLLTERDLTITANASTLSGDFNDDDAFEMDGDTLNIVNNTENAYHVVVSVAPDADPINNITRLDGFTIRGGNADDAAFTIIVVGGLNIFRYAGGGIINRNSSAPTLANLIFTGNAAIYGGGAYNRFESNAAYTNVIFEKNTAQLGGAVTNWNTASPVFTNVLITNNRADAGGGIYNLNGSSPVLSEVSINNNFATTGSGGGIFSNASSPVLTDVSIFENVSGISGGGMYNTTGSSPVITDSSFTQNTAPTGGGVFSSGNCNAVLTGVIIAQNQATAGNGGGYYNYQSVPVFTNVEISENSAAQFGGGLANFTQAPAIVNNSLITGNTATNGAGVFNYDASPAVYTNVIFTDNTATSNGGGAYNRGGSDAVYTNSLFTGNSANYGGGVYNLEEAEPVLTNVTITQNFAVTYGGGISSDNASPQIRNSILFGNSSTTGEGTETFKFNNANPTFAYSLVQGVGAGWEAFGTDGGNNTDTNPLFTDADNGDFTLTAESPVVNHGNSAYYTAGETPDLSAVVTDLAGNPRFYDGSPVDMGAYEIQEFVGVDGFSQLQVTCYPNPVVATLNIQAKDAVTGVTVYNMLGQEVTNAMWNKTNNTVDMAGVQAGSYFVKVSVGNALKSVIIVKK